MLANHFDKTKWTIVEFGNVVENKNESSKNLASEGLTRVVGLDDMDSESLPLRRWSEINDLPDGTTFTRKFSTGQVLFGKRRSYQKKVSVPDFDGVCSGDILVFDAKNEKILNDFLPVVVQSSDFMSHAIATSAGSLSPRTKWSDLAKYKFCLPSLEDQEKIIDIISSIDKTIEAYQNLPLVSQRESMLHELLSAGGEDWIETTLGEVGASGLFSDGDWVESKDQDPEGAFRLVQLADIGDGVFLDKSSRWLNKEQFQRLRCTALVPGDILIARMPDPIARACLFPHNLPVSATVVDVAILRCGPGYLPKFLVMLINHDTFRAAANSLITGTTRQRISRSNLSGLSFSVPPLDGQMRIVEIVSSIDDVIQATKQAILDLKVLRRSLLTEMLSVNDHG